MPATIANVNFGETVLCTNQGDDPVALMWNGKTYHLPPGRKVPVLFEAVVNHLGDPRSGTGVSPFLVGGVEGGEKGFIPDRESEIRRLRARYSNGIGWLRSMDDENRVWGAPEIVVETYDGEKIWTVVEDPQGTKASPVASTGDLSPRDLQAQVDRLQAQLSNLLADQVSKEAEIPYDTGAAQTELPDDVEASPVTTLEGEVTASKVKFPKKSE